MTDEPPLEPLRLNCPYCGQRLAVREAAAASGPRYQCPVHGQFLIDAAGRLRDVPRRVRDLVCHPAQYRGTVSDNPRFSNRLEHRSCRTETGTVGTVHIRCSTLTAPDGDG